MKNKKHLLKAVSQILFTYWWWRAREIWCRRKPSVIDLSR